MAYKRPRYNVTGDRLPVAVRIPGTNDEWTLREIEAEATTCALCKKRPRTLYSYDDDCRPYCNIRCWIKALTREVISLKRRREAAEQGVVQIASRTTRAASKAPRRQSSLAKAA